MIVGFSGPVAGREPAQDFKPVRWRVRRHEIRDRKFVALWPREENYRPFRDARLPDVDVMAWLGFVDVFALEDKGLAEAG